MLMLHSLGGLLLVSSLLFTLPVIVCIPNLPQLLSVLLPPFFISHPPFIFLPPGPRANDLGPLPHHLGLVPASLAGRFLGHWPCYRDDT